jgi:hypothetical protein
MVSLTVGRVLIRRVARRPPATSVFFSFDQRDLPLPRDTYMSPLVSGRTPSLSISRYQIVSVSSESSISCCSCSKTSDFQGQNNRDLGNSYSLTYLFQFYTYTRHLRAHCFTASPVPIAPIHRDDRCCWEQEGYIPQYYLEGEINKPITYCQ